MQYHVGTGVHIHADVVKYDITKTGYATCCVLRKYGAFDHSYTGYLNKLKVST